MRPRSPIEMAIDKATGYDPSKPPPKREPPKVYMSAFTAFVNAMDNHFVRRTKESEARLFRTWGRVRAIEQKSKADPAKGEGKDA